jgi:hypothetical protein
MAARGDWWLIRDSVESSEAHEGVCVFQCAAGVSAVHRDDTLVVSHGERRLAFVRAIGASGRWEIDDAIVSRRYGNRARARRARYVFPSSPPVTAVTFLVGRPHVNLGRVETALGGGTLLQLAAGEYQDSILLEWRDEIDGSHGVRTDARVAWVRRRASDRRVASALVQGGSFLEMDGVRLALPQTEIMLLHQSDDRRWTDAHGRPVKADAMRTSEQSPLLRS